MPTDPDDKRYSEQLHAAYFLEAMRAAHSNLAAMYAHQVAALATAEQRVRLMGDALRRHGATEAEVDELVNGDIDVVFRRSA